MYKIAQKKIVYEQLLSLLITPMKEIINVKFIRTIGMHKRPLSEYQLEPNSTTYKVPINPNLIYKIRCK
jgi:hypothetical protein